MEFTERKANRLQNFDYSSAAAYFITICTNEKKKLFWRDVGADIIRPEGLPLNRCGNIVRETILQIPRHYPGVFVDQYTVMPNHIHMILRIESSDGRMLSAPTVSRIVGMMKQRASRLAGFPLWQKSFHDHIIRGEADYREIWHYIENNPVKWTEDRFYTD